MNIRKNSSRYTITAFSDTMEMLMQYIWEHRLWNPPTMTTNDGQEVRIIDPGLRNHDAGPDFFNAKIEIGGFIWVGNIEIHFRASDWQRHGHDRDKAYDSVILHVVDKDDAPVFRSNGERIPQIVMQCSPKFQQRYAALINSKAELPCNSVISEMSPLEISEWMQAMAFERLRDKSLRIKDLIKRHNGIWEEVCYITFARNIGFGTNSDAFERLAKSLPLNLLHKHSDSLLQLEALFFGQAGMLDSDRYSGDKYYEQLRREYAFLKNKFTLRQPEGLVWKSFRMRPQNFPARRIALLAHFVYGSFRMMAQILDARGDEARLRKIFTAELTGYWGTHYSFLHESPEHTSALSKSSTDIILINTVAPIYYTYGEIMNDYDRIEQAIDLLEKLPAEKNRVTAIFANAALKINSALLSQAVLQIYNGYCTTRKCLYCKAGHKLLSTAATP